MLVERRIAPKLIELILHISQRSASDPNFGAIKLNKLLYFSDFLAYGRLGQSITGEDYQHLPHGPAPKRLASVRDDMIAHGELALQEVQLVFGNRQKRTVQLRAPDLSHFSAAEIALVDQVISSMDQLTAREISDLSHREVGWRATREGETIPFGTIFLSDEPLTANEQLRATQLMRQLEEQGRLPTSFFPLQNAS